MNHNPEYSENRPQLSPEVEIAATELFAQASLLLDTAPLSAQILASGEVAARNLTITRALDVKYPYNENVVTSEVKAAFYHDTRDRTSVITRYDVTIDGDPKRYMKIDFYSGAPFGHFYDTMQGATQFEAPANRTDFSAAVYQFNEETGEQEEVDAVAATPLRTISAWYDAESGSISDITSEARPPFGMPEDIEAYEDERTINEEVGTYSDPYADDVMLGYELDDIERADYSALQEADVQSMELWLTGAKPLPTI